MIWSFLYNEWLKSGVLNDSDAKKLIKLTPAEIEQNFERHIIFGKAGFRAKVGLGSNLFNRYTIKQIVFALCRALEKKENQVLEGQTFLVFHDPRANSAEISNYIAELFSSLKINVFTTPADVFCPTPFLSYLMNKKKADFGLIVTASHQSKEYNGIKVFFRKKGVINASLVDEINDQLERNHLLFLKKEWKTQKQLIKTYDWKTSQKKYFSLISSNLSLDTNAKKNTSITYSPLHGCGFNWTDKLLIENGYAVETVKQQTTLDGEFSSVENPNPESDSSFDLAIKLAKSNNSDLIILNDPDADRMRFAAKTEPGRYKIFSGNEIATIFIYFLLEEKKIKGTIYKTFVSSNLIDKIAMDYDIKIITTLTGFVNLAAEFNKSNAKKFVFAFEESIGYLPDKKISNDKDGIQAAFLIAEIACFLKNKNKNMKEYLNEIYDKYGYWYYDNFQVKIKSLGHIQQIHEKIRALKKIPDFKIKKMTIFFNEKGNNFYKISFANNTWISCRSSITEPIFKFYLTSLNKNPKVAKKNMKQLKKNWELFIKHISNVSEF